MVAESKILCAGHVNWDVVLHTTGVPEPDYSEDVMSETMKCGGSATNTALGLSSLGCDVAMLGSIGDDEYGQRIESFLDDAGVEPVLKRGEIPTTVIRAIVTDDADPRYFGKDLDLGAFSHTDVSTDTWAETDHVHVTSFDAEMGGEIAQAAKSDGKTVSFNPSQGYKKAEFPDVVDAADVIFLNEREADMFRRRYDFEAAQNDACLVITHGAAGSTAYTPHGVVTHSGFESESLADTIGAGDSFVAGFLQEWLADDPPNLDEALAMANACGANAVTKVGAPRQLDVTWIQNQTA